MKKKLVLGSMIGILSIVSIFMLSVGAFATTDSQGCDDDRHTAMISAFEEGDYEKWVSLMSTAQGGKGILRKVNTENFAEFAEYKLDNPSAKGNLYASFGPKGKNMHRLGANR